MEKLLSRIHEQDNFIAGFVDSLVERVISNIEDEEFTSEELFACTSTIQCKVNSQLAYKLLSETIWKAKNIK